MTVDHSDDSMLRSCRILVVDDEDVVRSVIRSSLERPGWYLVDVEDGEKAIELLFSEPFDVLIADKNLPDITGLDVIRRARAADSRIGTLLVTAYASRESAEEAMAIGVDDFLTKPFSVRELIDKVDDALGRRRQRAKLMQKHVVDIKPATRQVVVCDPSLLSRSALEVGLTSLGHKVTLAAEVSQVLAGLRNKSCDALICDLELLNRDDASACFLRSALLLSPSVLFVAIAARPGLEGALNAIHRGARKVIYRPIASPEQVVENLSEFFSS